MKALLLVLAFGAITSVILTVAFRVLPSRLHATALVAVYAVSLCGLSVAFLLTPPDLGFLAGEFLTGSIFLEFAVTWLLYTAGYLGGLVQLYNLASRGLSLRMLIDMLEASPPPDSVKQVADGYCAGRGLAWMYEKRLEGLDHLGYITVHGGKVELTKNGAQKARVFDRLQDLLGIGSDLPEGSTE